ncbi:MAG TPA: hypothetical protein VI583_04840 [Cyclobacteriaceae bacterium]|nr:hypothetical protein [Cyclobacteriaceae bacterium]
MKPAYAFFFTIFVIKAAAQDTDAYLILENVKKTYEQINDYSAKATINVNVDFIHIPQKEAEVFFKAPDKYRYKSPGFIMIPRKGVDFSIIDIMSRHYDAIYSGMRTIGNEIFHEVKVIPSGNQGDLVLATLLIDRSSWFITRVEAITRKSGSFVIDFYQKQGEMPLPDSVRITFEVDKLSFPLKFMGNMKVDAPEAEAPDQASVTIRYSNYKVNTGLKDDIFNEQPIEE